MRRGDATTPVLMWFVGAIAAVIVVTWYMKSAGLSDTGLPEMDEDLKNVHYDLALGCSNSGLRSDVRLHTDRGAFTFNDTDICIFRPLAQGNVTRCLPTPCPIGTEGTIDIGESNAVRIEKRTDAGTSVFGITGQ